MIIPGTRDVLFQLFLNGITPVLAHPERNLALQRNPDILSDLVTMGCLVQLTAMSITGELGHEAMVTENPRIILDGKPFDLPEPGKTAKKQGWLERWFGRKNY
jgi:tyrosine-protein phosphatase YwqE